MLYLFIVCRITIYLKWVILLIKLTIKSKDTKDKVVDTTKNLGDKATDAATGSSSSFSIGQEKKYEENGSEFRNQKN